MKSLSDVGVDKYAISGIERRGREFGRFGELGHRYPDIDTMIAGARVQGLLSAEECLCGDEEEQGRKRKSDNIMLDAQSRY